MSLTEFRAMPEPVRDHFAPAPTWSAAEAVGTGRPKNPRLVLVAGAALLLIAVAAAAWSARRAAESRVAADLMALDVEIGDAASILELAGSETDALINDAASWHGWLEVNDPTGSAALMESLRRIAAPVSGVPSGTVHRELVATGRIERIADAPLRGRILAFYVDLDRLGVASEEQAAFRAALDEHLPLAAWRYVFDQDGTTPQPLSYQEAVRVLYESGFDAQVRGVLRGLAERRATIERLRDEAVGIWAAVRTLRDDVS